MRRRRQVTPGAVALVSLAGLAASLLPTAVADRFATAMPTGQPAAGINIPFLPAADDDPRSPRVLPRLAPVAHVAAAAAATTACPPGAYSCAAAHGAAFDGICCVDSQVCMLDADHQPACCPRGYACTGRPATTFTSATATATYVPNTDGAVFPYLLLPPGAAAATAALADSAACVAVAQQCSQAYAQCTAQLEGGSGGGDGHSGGPPVTAAAVGGTTTTTTEGALAGGATAGHHGVTIVVAGSTTLTKRAVGTAAATTTHVAAAAAASICSSLRSEACGDLPINAADVSASCASLFASVTTAAGGNNNNNGNGGATATGFSVGNGGSQLQRAPTGPLGWYTVVMVLLVAWLGLF
ncbi:Twin-arginine translocation pathway, signal sequence [Niveomyces insectorum RCEF 264]|uniref:Twin-arginine translocation pathway, signal sequence n=1 Tax=Niveomyces insectorum RCEF 264 TaxID=1081102 RepID=A0A167SQ85_9HYPO|nr:Twin-arginine translocation pathway, signal sequence [Niveomyces insectorum RCEF 264]